MVNDKHINDGFYEWVTEYSHSDNNEIAKDFIDNHMPNDWTVVWDDGSYIEVIINDYTTLAIIFSENLDSYNHLAKIEIV